MTSPVVSCRGGKVKGSTLKLKCKDGKQVYCYRNIPFGKPPTGSLRFMPPLPSEPWKGVKDGTVRGPMPMQSLDVYKGSTQHIPCKPHEGEMKVSEDCLHITVYTPTPVNEKLPVMVWIYGGGFQIGSESMEDLSALAGMNDVVVAVPNYRVGIFGFFTMGPSSICPGNVGLMDQNLALKWVRDNIEAFGGDKNNVTIFGESAGGISVNHHVISPMSRSLFHRAISQSGQSTMPDHFLFDPTENNKALLKHFKIEESDEIKIVEALQKISADKLVEGMTALAMEKIYYFPTVDGKFLVKTPWKALEDKEFIKLPYIIGCNNSEGQGVIALMAAKEFAKGLTEEEAKKAIFRPVTDAYFEAWKKFYIHDENDDKRFSKLLGYVASDSWFLVPAVTTASAYAAKGADVFMYQGAFRLRLCHDDEYGSQTVKKPEWWNCDNGDDVCMMIGTPFSPGEMYGGGRFSEEEEILSTKCMTYITNFAKFGDPNKGVKVGVKWPKYKPNGEHIILNNPVTVGENLGYKEVEFWTKTFAELERKEATKA